MLHNNQTSQQLTLWFTNVTVLTAIELHYKFWKWHKLQRSWNIENFLYREHEIQKGGPQIMTSWYDDVVPRHAPHIWGRRRRCVFDLPYACTCKYTRGFKLRSSNMIRKGEVRWSHNVQFCLKSEVSLEHRTVALTGKLCTKRCRWRRPTIRLSCS